MGRSVMTLDGDSTVAYQTFEPSHYCDEHEVFNSECQCEVDCGAYCSHEDEFEWFVDDVRARVAELWPSLTEADRWIGNEVHVVAENAHSVVAVAEYGGLVSISLGSNYDRGEYWRDPEPTLGAHWRSQISERFLTEFSEYDKIGTFSNGESVYTKREVA